LGVQSKLFSLTPIRLNCTRDFFHKGSDLMSSMTFDAETAKSLLTNEELQLYQHAQSDRLPSLTQNEIKDLVSRSRTARNKWRDVSRSQRRSTQSDRGHRQTAENARSKDKALLLSEVHQAFVDRRKAIDSGQATAKTGNTFSDPPRSDRKIVTRAVRSVTRNLLKDKKRKINKKARANESNENETSSIANTKPNNQRGENAKMKKPTSKTSKTAKASPSTRKSSSKKAPKTKSTKKPVVTKARKKMLAQQAEQAKKDSVTMKASVPQAKPELEASVTQSAKSARNRKMHARATENRKKIGGTSTRIKGHVSARGKRDQARRDSKLPNR
jgi:hypothetical protein